MTVNDLIHRLQMIETEYGDIPVGVCMNYNDIQLDGSDVNPRDGFCQIYDFIDLDYEE